MRSGKAGNILAFFFGHDIILFSTVIEEKNERKAFEIGPNAHFYLDENVVWDLHFIIFF